MDTIFIYSEKSKTSDAHRLLLNPLDRINLKRSNKYVTYIYNKYIKSNHLLFMKNIKSQTDIIHNIGSNME